MKAYLDELKCRPLFRLKLNYIPILHERMWMWHHIGAFMWKTDVSLFLSRLAGTVVWRESQLFVLLCFPASFSFKLSFNPVASPLCFYPQSLLHLSISLHIATLFHSFSCRNLPRLPLFNPFSRCLTPASPPTSLPLEVMLLSAHSCIKQLDLIISWQQHKK